MRIEYTCPSQSGCERLRIYRRACGKSRLWEKHVRPHTNGTVEGRLQGTRKVPLAKVGIPSAFRRREDVKLYVPTSFRDTAALIVLLEWRTLQAIKTSAIAKLRSFLLPVSSELSLF